MFAYKRKILMYNLVKSILFGGDRMKKESPEEKENV